MSRILLVDDDPDILDILSEYLGSVGYEVVAVNNGARLREVLASHQFTAAVVDWSLPDLPGAQLLRLLEEGAPGCPVMITTGHLREVVPTEKPVFAVVRKPYSLRALSLRLDELSQGESGGRRTANRA